MENMEYVNNKIIIFKTIEHGLDSQNDKFYTDVRCDIYTIPSLFVLP